MTFSCRECEREFDSPQALGAHRGQQHGPDMRECVTCKREFRCKAASKVKQCTECIEKSGKFISEDHKQAISEAMTGKTLEVGHRNAIRQGSNNAIGEDSPHWKGGSKNGLSLSQWYDLKTEILIRDHGRCVECGIAEHHHIRKFNRKMPTHHIDGDDSYHVEENLETRCLQCHAKVHAQRGDLPCMQ